MVMIITIALLISMSMINPSLPCDGALGAVGASGGINLQPSHDESPRALS
jgi:hypothetical protein